MNRSGVRLLGVATILPLLWIGCGGADPVETVVSRRSDAYEIQVLAPGGQFNRGSNRVAVEVTRDGQPVTIESATIRFHMPAMGSMQRMDTHAELRGRNGRAEGAIAFEMGGGWNGATEITTPEGPITAEFRVEVR